MSVVAGRYAKALLDLAVSSSAVPQYQKELAAVSEILETEKDLNHFLLSPQNSPANRKDVLAHVFQGAVSKNILNLLFLLLDKGRIDFFPQICSAYTEMAEEYQNILPVTVTTALPLDPAQIDRIGEKIQSIFHGYSVKITVETDDSLIGGVQVTAGGKRYDGSIKGKLSKLQSALAGQ